MKVRKIPQRMCVGCQEMFPKRQLVRIVRSPEGELSLDITGKKSGRGAYICHNPDCFHLAIKAKRLQRALKCELSSQLIETLADELGVRDDKQKESEK